MFLGYSLLEWAQILSAFSVVTSLILAILYARMATIEQKQSQIQEKQTEIMERQNRLMAASHKPDIRIDSEKIRVNDNRVSISLTNLGNGPARHLQIRCEANCYPEASTRFTLESSTTSLQRVNTSPKRAVKPPEGQSPEPDDTILAGEKDIEFSSTIFLNVQSRNEKDVSGSIPFDRATQRLNDAGVEGIRIILFLTFEDIAGDHDEIQIQSLGRHCEIENKMRLEDAIEKGNHTARGGTITVTAESRTERIWSRITQFIPF